MQELSRHFDSVLVVPCGPRPEKPSNDSVPPVYRAAMTDVIFDGLPNVEVDLFDLEQATANARQVHPGIDIIELSCQTGQGFEVWQQWLTDRRSAARERFACAGA